jgi:hypothetical protein
MSDTTTLHHLWDRLAQVRSLSFVARSETTAGWSGKGSGSVELVEIAPGIITFSEQGTWRPAGGHDIRFTNVYRWTLADGLLRLEHLRQGISNPVHLLDLAQVGEREWRPVSPHQCGDDCYSAVLVVHDDRLVLRWSVDGPRKRETVEYIYS